MVQQASHPSGGPTQRPEQRQEIQQRRVTLLPGGPARRSSASYSSEEKPVPTIASDGRPEAPGKVEVQPFAIDGKIRQRIVNILKTTGWFGEPKVTVREGIVSLKGTTENDESKQWAGHLAKNTEDVVANRSGSHHGLGFA